MKIAVLFDKDAIDERFQTGWGLSFLVGERILFDSGEKFEDLAHNAKALGLDLGKVRKVVISHEHWDHSNGLWGLLEVNKKVTVYACVNFSPDFKARVQKSGGKIVEVKDRVKVAKNIYCLGGNVVMYKGQALVEQMLVIEEADKLTLLCGDCHPGALNIIHKAGCHFGKKVDCLLGGLHLMDKEQRFINYVVDQVALLVRRVGLTHCTGHAARNLFGQIYKDNFLEIKAGTEIEI